MTKSQWRVFILFTLPFCAVALSAGIAKIANESKAIRVGNVRSSKSTYSSYAEQEKLEIGNFDY